MDKVFLLTLMKLPKVSRRTVKKVIDTMEYTPKNIQELYDLLEITKQKYSRLKLPTHEQLEKASLTAENIINRAKELNINIVGYLDPDFPKRLRNIIDPPVILYTKGNTDCLKGNPAVAIVGTRQPTKFGKTMAERFGKKLGSLGVIVVSGLAIGCDTAAHEGCLAAGGKTVAVLANSLETIYPKQNRVLAEKILSDSGCLISEHPPGEITMKNYFVERNRLQSGLSDAIFVVETGFKGGSMHTVNYAIKQNREVACLEHPEEFKTNKSSGNNKLIMEGKAIPLKELKDIEILVNIIAKKSRIDELDSNENPLDEKGEQLKIFD